MAVLPARPGEGGCRRGARRDRAALRAQAVAGGQGKSADPLAALPGWLRALALRLSPSGIAAKLQRRLDLAGNPERWKPDRILAVKALGLVVLGRARRARSGAHSPAC